MKRNICIVLFVIVVLLNIYDVYSTNTLFTSDLGFYEINPMLRALMNKIGVPQFTNVLAIMKGMALLWAFSFIIRAKTNYEFNLALAGFALVVGCYSTVMYFANYKGMLFLTGGI